MDAEEVLVRYDIKEFMGYKDANDILPVELEKYCLTNNNNILTIREEFKADIDNIVTSTLNGIDPNDILLKTTIRDILNKVSLNNYEESLNKLKKIKYTNQNHFGILAQDIIDRSMNDPVACKGFNPSVNDAFISDINANIAKEFCQFCIEEDSNDESTDKIRFKNTLTGLCQKQYVEFMDESKKLDANNRHRVDNYKGFMNFIGLLYNRNILSSKIIIVCLLGIKKLIFESDWSESECENLFSGYDRLVTQLIFNLKQTKTKDSEAKAKDTEMLSAMIKITEAIGSENEIKVKLRRIPMLTHENLLKQLSSVNEQNYDSTTASVSTS